MRWEDTVLRPGGVEVPAGKEDAPAAQEKSGGEGTFLFLGLNDQPGRSFNRITHSNPYLILRNKITDWKVIH